MIAMVRRMGWLALVPAAMAGTAIPLHAEAGPAMFAPPEAPLVLTRSLLMPFPDGRQIAVTRKYEVRFSRTETGFRVEGRLLETEVEAPARLSALAEMERRRPEVGLFPVLLDQRGMVFEPSPGSAEAKTTRQAAAGARAIVAKSATPPGLREEIEGALEGLTSGARRSAWPPFLFNPGNTDRSDSRAVTLSDGTTGTIETRIRVDGLLLGGLPRRVERDVTTHFEGTQRATREVWTFSF